MRKKESFENEHMKDIQIFLKKKKKKKRWYHRDRTNNLSEKENQKKVEYIRNRDVIIKHIRNNF